MRTRADFWILSEKMVEWIGSIAWDGHIKNFIEECKINDKIKFKERIMEILKNRDDSTFPENGWPWRWHETGITDITYIFVEKYNKVFLFKPNRINTDQKNVKDRINGYLNGYLVDPLIDYHVEMPSMNDFIMRNFLNPQQGSNKSGTIYIIPKKNKSGLYPQDLEIKPEKPFKAIFYQCPFCEEWIDPIKKTCECKEIFEEVKDTIKEGIEEIDTWFEQWIKNERIKLN